jgi:glutamate formiminotransferase
MNPDCIIECVPNFSEGNDAGVVRQIVAAMQVEEVKLLDWSLDTAHNRSVVTIAGPALKVIEAAVRGVGKAAHLIDLTRQNGVHPRIGAADVVPFVPVSGLSLAEAAMLARQAGLDIWRRYGVPVYFYEAAAMRPDRVNLEDVRRGQFEGLRDSVMRDSARRPDVGGPELHGTAGASAVGARSFLIAYNVYLEQREAMPLTEKRVTGGRLDGLGQPDITAARAIAREIRASSGGLYGVKAIGVAANGRAQVSMNITNYRVTPMPQVYATVAELARKHGAVASGAELIGLIPAEVYEPDGEWIRQINGFDPEEKVLERKLHRPMAWPEVSASGRP